MKRSPFKIVMVVLGYLAAGAVVNLVVAAACALWAPYNDPYRRSRGTASSYVARWIPDQWGHPGHVAPTRDKSKRLSVRTREYRGVGVSAVDVQEDEIPEEAYRRAEAAHLIMVRAGVPWRCVEAACTIVTNPAKAFPGPVVNGYFEPALWVPLKEEPRPLARITHYPEVFLSEITRNFIPLSPVWPAMIANTIVWALLLAFIVYAPRRLRAEWRLHHGVCPRCAYPIGVSAKCTECGHVLSRLPLKVGTP